MKYTKDELIELLIEADKSSDGVIIKNEMDDMNGVPASVTYNRRFRSWNAAKEIAGVEKWDRYDETVNEDFFYNIDEKSSYWVGFLIGDGSVYEYGENGKYRIKLSLSEKDVEKFNKDINSTYSITRHRHNVEVTLNNQKFIHGAIKHGVTPRKTTSGTLPNLEEHNRHMIRGYIDADGSIGDPNYKSFTCSITAINKERLECVNDIVPFRDGNIRERNHKRAYDLSWHRISDAQDIYRYLYPNGENTSPKLERKFDRLSGWI